MKNIPTRIPGVSIARSGLGNPRELEQPRTGERILRLDSGSLCEPHFVARQVASRTLACIDGEAYAMIVDVRRKSPTFGRWIGLYLSKENRRILQFSTDIACGWIATATHARLRIVCNETIQPDNWQWLKWDDREVALEWPEVPLVVVNNQRHSCPLSSLPNKYLPVYARDNVKPIRSSGRGAKLQPRIVMRKRKTVEQPPLIEKLLPISKWNLKAESASVNIASRTVKSNHRGKSSSANGTTMSGQPLILVIGSTGQLGRDLCRHLRSVGTVLGASRSTERNQLLPMPIEVEISRPASLRQIIRQIRPQLIVNASGMTDVDRAEAEPRLAQLINATAPAVIAEEAERCGAAIVHYCTDMVFSGDGEKPWSETDEPRPLCQYARTKLIGTEAIQASKAAHLILRSGWLYSTHGENYVRQTIDMSLYRNSLSLAADHYGSPTSTSWLAEVTAKILSRAGASILDWLSEHGGLFHCATLGYASRAEVAEHVLAGCRQHRMPVVTRSVHSVPLAELPSLATRPANCRLNCSLVTRQLGITLPRWQDQLTEQMSLMIDGQVNTLQAVA